MCDIIRIHFKAIQGAKKGLIETWRQGQKNRAKIGLKIAYKLNLACI
jgi:hypothetical protein